MGTDSDHAEVKDSGSKDEETSLLKLPYPKSVFFIVSNEFCERFSYYGMRTILVIYLTNILLYSEGTAKIIYHTFAMLTYFFPVLGAIISDSFLGKFRTILYVSMIYACGNILLALSATEPLGIPQKEFSIVGLLLIALGTGGIKPCVAAFGGDQFVLPDQELHLVRFFSLFYFSINAGSLISTFLTPILRNNVHCFDLDSCFPLAFAVPGGLMILSILIFAAGKPLYKIKKPEGNVVVQVSKCIGHAISQKYKSKEEKKAHWLDYAEPVYGTKLVSDIKATLKVLVLYIPLPIFWALYDQQGSGWTFQAIRMDGNIGFYTILPDQMQVINPLLILAFIPLFSYGIYPLLAKCNFLTTPLQRMVCGGFLAAIAFGISAVISLALEATYPVLPSSGNIQLRVYNPSACDVTINAPSLNISQSVVRNGYYVNKDISFTGNGSVEFTFTSPCNTYESKSFEIEEKTAIGIYLSKIGAIHFEDEVEKSEDGYPRLRTLAYDTDLEITYTQKKGSSSLDVGAGNYSLKSLPYPGTYRMNVIGKELTFKLGGTYTVMINQEINDQNIRDIIVTEPNSIHMLLLLPQYFIITAAEIMYSITGLEFSYSQAPVSMKALLQACFLLTTAFGNLIIIIIESAQMFEKQSNDFFLYTGLMVVDMLLFAFMTTKYVYVIPEDSETEELKEDEPLKKLGNGIDNPSFSPIENSSKEN